jgi:hypothetical protein
MASHIEPRGLGALGSLLLGICACSGSIAVEASVCADASGTMDVAAEPETGRESMDAGFDVAAIDVYAPACFDDNDCEGAETCQEGVCCAGLFASGKCTCGHGPGCDLFHLCCKVASSPSLAVCASDSYECCGGFQGAQCDGGP